MQADGGKALTSPPDHKTAGTTLSAKYHDLAKRASEAGERLEAINHLRLAFIYAESRAEKETMLLERADLYLAMRNHHEAGLIYQIFNRHYPDSHLLASSYAGLGDAQAGQGMHDEALRSYEKAGRHTRALLGRIRILNNRGRTGDASAVLRSLTPEERESLKSSDDFVFETAEILRSEGKHREAIDMVSLVKDSSYDHRKAYMLGMIALSQDKRDEAKRHLRDAAGAPDRELRRKAMMTLADLALKMDQRSEAKDLYRQIIAVYPHTRESRGAAVFLASMERQDGRLLEALSLLRDLLLYGTPEAGIRDMAAELILALSDSDQGSFVRYWFLLGGRLRDHSRSETLLRIARKLRNEGAPFFDLCGWLYQNGAGRAREECGVMLAHAYADRGDFAAARRYMGAFDPGDDKALGIGARIYAADRQNEKSMELLLSLRNPGREDVRLMLDLLPSARNRADLLTRIERALGKTGGDARTYARFADCLFGSGRQRDALEYYRIAQALQIKNEKVSADERDWVAYRISLLTEGDAAKAQLASLSSKDPLISRIADARRKEMALNKRITGVLR